MKKLLLVFALLLTGCVKEEVIDDGGVTPPVDEVVIEVTLEGIVEELGESAILVNSELGLIWFSSEEEITEVGVGDLLVITYNDELAESNPMQGSIISYEITQKYVAPSFDITASAILQDVINGSEVEFGGSMEDVITEDNMQWYLGSNDYPEFLDSAVYTPMMNVDVSLMVVLKVELDEVDALKASILENIDPNRLVCVTFDLETDVVIDSYGDTVILIINKAFTTELHDAFTALQ